MSIAYPDVAPPELLDRELNDTLRMELGWEEVGKGLTRILFGYAVWVTGIVVGLTIALSPLFEMGAKFNPRNMGIGHMWALYAGLGLVSVSSLMANGLILTGQWRCLLNASERGWARWWMFICMITLAMGPALSLASNLGGFRQAPEFGRGVNGFDQVRYTLLGMMLQLTSFGFGIMYLVSFTLFLQTSAQCMASSKHILMTNLFLAILAPLSMVSVYLAVKITMEPPLILKLVKPLAFVGLGWVIVFFFWLLMIALVRFCILGTMKMVRTPMEYAEVEEQARKLNW